MQRGARYDACRCGTLTYWLTIDGTDQRVQVDRAPSAGGDVAIDLSAGTARVLPRASALHLEETRGEDEAPTHRKRHTDTCTKTRRKTAPKPRARKERLPAATAPDSTLF